MVIYYLTYILYVNYKDCLYRLAHGKTIGMQKSDVYIKTPGSESWQLLHEFLNVSGRFFCGLLIKITIGDYV